ncbi:hypothetical protein QBC44DRAFT_311863 [Cladorrhinum sp. PSN332]|nr:hypothetical protein QBC44DRAFT_311863 [Cladorrhinum sp. PSN332]
MLPKSCTDSQVIARTLTALKYEAKEEDITLPSATLPLPEFLSELKACGVPVHSPTFSIFLSGEDALNAAHRFEKEKNSPLPVPCTAGQARAWLAVFPLKKMDFPLSYYSDSKPLPATKFELRGERSADLLVPLARWPKSNADRLEIARMLLENKGTDPNGNTPIYHCWCYTPSELAMAPIHIAAGTGDKDMVELLLEFGADKDKKDGYNRTALDLAKAKGKRDVVKLLVE